MTENSLVDVFSYPEPKKKIKKKNVQTREPLSCGGSMEGCVSSGEKYNTFMGESSTW